MDISGRTVDKVFIGESEVSKIFIGSNLVYTKEEPMPTLTKPTNVTVNLDVAYFDGDVNAETYEAFVDNVSIGEINIGRLGTTTINSITGNDVSVTLDDNATMVEAFVDGTSIGIVNI